MPTELISSDYAIWLTEVKTRIQSARSRAALAVNSEVVRLYHSIGRDILERQTQQGWGSKVIPRIAADLKDAFPDIKGFSASNIKYMRFFAEHCPVPAIAQQLGEPSAEAPSPRFGQQPADQLPWFHIVILLTKAKPTDREWYAVHAVAGGWSRDTLKRNIETRLKDRQGAAITNFEALLPPPHSALAQETLKDPYNFDFLGLADDAHEREIENALIRHITRFLLELGTGFAFVGRQFRLEVGGDEFFIDLLFYHTRLKRYVVIELKGSAFKPEHVGQLNFYLSAVDSQIKREDDHPTIGLLLCKTQNRIVAEYALRDTTKPMGIAEYQLLQSLPEPLQTNLPSIEELEAELAADPLAAVPVGINLLP
jgi:predicted nuclease of restriction endonuclease-like (RecB) superfamily